MVDKERPSSPDKYVQEERKDKILHTAPMLAAFLGRAGTEEENRDQLHQKMEEYGEKFNQGLGEATLQLSTNPMVVLASQLKLFHPEASLNDSADIRTISSQLMFMGYELHNDEDMIDKFAGDVTLKLRGSPLVLKESHYGNLNSFVEAGMRTGVLLAEDLKKQKVNVPSEKTGELVELTEGKEEDPSVFRDFINTLDIGDL